MIGWAWRASRDINPDLKWRLKFLLAAGREPTLASRLEHLDRSSRLAQLIDEWPETLGFLLAPYQCASWDPPTRFEKIEAHLGTIQSTPGLVLKPDEKLVLADLGKFSPGVRLILDRPRWLSREGHLTLSIFKDEFRAFTLTFSLSSEPDRSIFIGSIQGRQDADILALYRELTKEFHGIRPRDLIIEMLRIFAANLGVQHIDAVADESKISRHPYYGQSKSTGLDYNEIWEDRGGARVDSTRFNLPSRAQRRELEEISPKKRSMYRRRYEMLDELSGLLPKDLATAPRCAFDAT